MSNTDVCVVSGVEISGIEKDNYLKLFEKYNFKIPIVDENRMIGVGDILDITISNGVKINNCRYLSFSRFGDTYFVFFDVGGKLMLVNMDEIRIMTLVEECPKEIREALYSILEKDNSIKVRGAFS